jgi:hypothetical protein
MVEFKQLEFENLHEFSSPHQTGERLKEIKFFTATCLCYTTEAVCLKAILRIV